jgi:hypothetical protein
MARFLRQKLLIANQIVLAARDPQPFSDIKERPRKKGSKHYERRISFFGDVRTCQPRPNRDLTAEYLSEILGGPDVEILDCIEPSSVDHHASRYWGMAQEEKGFFRIQNLETAPALTRGIHLALAITKKILLEGDLEAKGHVTPYQILGMDGLNEVPGTKWMTHDPLKLYELGRQKELGAEPKG